MSDAREERDGRCLSDSDDQDDGKQENDWNDWEEDEATPSKCLLCPVMLNSVDEALHHGTGIHGLDLPAIIRDAGLDFYGTIKLINYIRTVVEENGGELSTLELPTDLDAQLEGERYLRPVIADDPFLHHDFDGERWDSDSEAPDAHCQPGEAGAVSREVAELRAQLEAMRQQMADLVLNQPVNMDNEASGPTRAEEFDDNYIDSYSHFHIHEEMLRDTVRTLAYRDAMYKNPEVFNGKIVLDVGCGTGILSMMAARAGAKHVYGVDFSATADKAKLIVQENGLSDKVTIIRGKIEEIRLPVETVDIIISEWMGYFLIFESMYSSVLWARDKWLAPDGIVFPDQATVYLTAIDSGERLDYWDDVYGFRMSCMKVAVRTEAAVEVVDPWAVMATTSLVYSMDMQTLRAGDTGFDSPFHLVCTKDTEVRAFMSYFDVAFEHKCQTPVYMTTGAASAPTHWKQTVLYLETPLTVRQNWAVAGTIKVYHDKDSPRQLRAELSFSVVDQDGQAQQGPYRQLFKM